MPFYFAITDDTKNFLTELVKEVKKPAPKSSEPAIKSLGWLGSREAWVTHFMEKATQCGNCIPAGTDARVVELTIGFMYDELMTPSENDECR